MINIFAIIGISVVTVGLMELVKNFLPENTSAKVSSIISLALSVVAPVVYGIFAKWNVLGIVVNTVAVVGLTQTSYNFVLKLLKALIEKLKSGISKVTTTEDETKSE